MEMAGQVRAVPPTVVAGQGEREACVCVGYVCVGYVNEWRIAPFSEKPAHLCSREWMKHLASNSFQRFWKGCIYSILTLKKIWTLGVGFKFWAIKKMLKSLFFTFYVYTASLVCFLFLSSSGVWEIIVFVLLCAFIFQVCFKCDSSVLQVPLNSWYVFSK